MIEQFQHSGRISIRNTAFFLFRSLLDFVYPPYCVLCGGQVKQDNGCICGACDSDIPRLEKFRIPAGEMDVPDAACFKFGHIISVFEYKDLLPHLVHLFKYRQSTVLVNYFGEQLCRGLSCLDDIDYDGIIPVPLHPVRKRERGYNQSGLLAGYVSRRVRVKLINQALKRGRYTDPQAKQTREARIQNLRGAFRVAAPGYIRDRKILLVDDVVTTGSTVNECARVLMQAGAVSVDVLSLARVEKKFV